MKIIVFLLLIGILLISCGDNTATNPRLPPAVIGALERVTIADNTLELWTGLQRDFMPVCPPDGHPLAAHIRIYDINSHPIPQSIRPESLWVIDNNEFWADYLTRFRWSADNDTIYCGNYNGPKWDPGREVDVIVKFVHVNKAYYLKAENQVIFPTY